VQTSLLTTKLYFPPTRPSLVARPRLVERLLAGLRGPLTLISAPAGSGKTTLLSEWHSGSGIGTPVAWYSLDKEDNDPARFFQYLFASLDTLQPGLMKEDLRILQVPEKPSIKTVMTILVNRLASFSRDCVLVLDDYHLIENRTIQKALAFLLEYLPACLHLVLVTRADPPLTLSRMRARGDLTEIRAEHLRFTANECAQFLKQVMGLDLTAEQVVSLEKRTEGWVAGLQLAALSMQGRKEVQGFVLDFSGSNSYIGDYLAEEVLNRQPQTIRSFLLETSTLDRINASLCDAVTGRKDSQTMLEKLEQGNLFLVPLDDQRGWYRYHSLFADLLRVHLGDMQLTKVPELLRRAAGWFAQSGLMEEAISYALRARDMEQAACWIEQYSGTLLSQGRLATLTAWTSSLPEEIIANRPRLGFSQAWALYLEYQFNQTEALLGKIEMGLTPEQARQLAGELALWHGIIARWHGDLNLSRASLQLALEQLPTDAHFLKGRARLFLGMVHMVNDANLAEAMFIRARENYETENYVHGSLASLYYLASTQNLQGSPIRAFATSQRAVRLSDQVRDWPVGSYADLALAEAYYAQNELEQAASQFQKGLLLAELGGHTNNLYIASLVGASIERASGHVDQAQQLITRAEEIARSAIALMMAQVNSEQILLFLVQGKTVDAAEWLRQSQVLTVSKDLFPIAVEHISRARVALAKKNPAEVSSELSGLLERVIEAGMLHLAIQIYCLQAMSYYALGQSQEALEGIRKVLVLAEPQNAVRVLVDQGIALLPLLQEALRKKITPDFTARILRAFDSAWSKDKTSSVLVGHRSNVLSTREIELLGLIAAGCSNKEIASRLVISVATVKRHTTNIFNKLDAKNRTEAVARARELSLL
jgi:LuxR family transcriptional regulator, maltose regulon positive regulatory protein